MLDMPMFWPNQAKWMRLLKRSIVMRNYNPHWLWLDNTVTRIAAERINTLSFNQRKGSKWLKQLLFCNQRIYRGINTTPPKFVRNKQWGGQAARIQDGCILWAPSEAQSLAPPLVWSVASQSPGEWWICSRTRVKCGSGAFSQGSGLGRLTAE